MAIVRCLTARHHNSALTPSSDGAWDRGVGAVIGLIRQIHSYERSPDSCRPKADVGEGIRVVLKVSCKPLLTFASRYEDASRSSYAIQET
jgi:hypothetical protein